MSTQVPSVIESADSSDAITIILSVKICNSTFSALSGQVCVFVCDLCMLCGFLGDWMET